MSLPTARYYSPSAASFATAMASGAPVFQPGPNPGSSTPYWFTQKWIQKNSSWTPTALNTAHPDSDYSAFKLQGESAREDIGGGLVEWTRTYAKTPASWSEPTTLAYNFIGYYGLYGINVTTVNGRPRFTKTVAARIEFDYYLIDGVTYSTVSDLPVEEEQKYLVGESDSLTTDYLADAPPFNPASNPTRSEYESWVTNGQELVAVPSTFRRWLGNIMERQTTYIKAQ